MDLNKLDHIFGYHDFSQLVKTINQIILYFHPYLKVYYLISCYLYTLLAITKTIILTGSDSFF